MKTQKIYGKPFIVSFTCNDKKCVKIKCSFFMPEVFNLRESNFVTGQKLLCGTNCMQIRVQFCMQIMFLSHNGKADIFKQYENN